MRKVKMHVYGRVQGVGFRFITMMLAKELNVVGSVENLDDGSVYIEAMADKDAMATFIMRIENSPSPSSHVEKVVIENDDTLADFKKFRIL